MGETRKPYEFGKWVWYATTNNRCKGGQSVFAQGSALEFGCLRSGCTMMQRPAVGDRPGIPLHTNGSNNHIRCQATKRKISGGARSKAGRGCRDAVFGHRKSCAKGSIPFQNRRGNRLNAPGAPPLFPTSSGRSLHRPDYSVVYLWTDITHRIRECPDPKVQFLWWWESGMTFMHSDRSGSIY